MYLTVMNIAGSWGRHNSCRVSLHHCHLSCLISECDLLHVGLYTWLFASCTTYDWHYNITGHPGRQFLHCCDMCIKRYKFAHKHHINAVDNHAGSEKPHRGWYRPQITCCLRQSPGGRFRDGMQWRWPPPNSLSSTGEILAAGLRAFPMLVFFTCTMFVICHEQPPSIYSTSGALFDYYGSAHRAWNTHLATTYTTHAPDRTGRFTCVGIVRCWMIQCRSDTSRVRCWQPGFTASLRVCIPLFVQRPSLVVGIYIDNTIQFVGILLRPILGYIPILYVRIGYLKGYVSDAYSAFNDASR